MSLWAILFVSILCRKSICQTDSDEMESENIFRKSMTQQEYDGLPIEYPVKSSRTDKLTTKLDQVSETPDRRFRRIYNADEVASIEEFPFLAALLVNKQLWCGAAIIASDRVLTAAHCLQLQYNNRFFREYVKMLTIRLGSSNATSGGEIYQVSEIFFHPNYKPDTLEFNFAVVRLHRNISNDRMKSKVAKIDFATERIVPTDSVITFLGWGSVLGIGGLGGKVLLQKLELPIYDLADCQEIYGRELVTRTNFCAGYITKAKNVCNHDAGGPAILNGVLVGILSFSSKRCDILDQPAVFSAVGAVTTWIDTIGESSFKLTNSELKYPDWINKQE
ncbi:trypsin-like isoform X1 [Pieris brassicae]|uniref:trypsin-like isoform X1 n=1 Tax=Pieris brassicae TaxID=7116 RepID=UPI001E660C5F|nr:trypsin-like isoform X1 [Pieris brassicae]